MCLYNVEVTTVEKVLKTLGVVAKFSDQPKECDSII